MVLHLAEVAFLWSQHRVDLRSRDTALITADLNRSQLHSRELNMLHVVYLSTAGTIVELSLN